MTERITIGLMSGTSLDGTDAVAMAFDGRVMRSLGHSSLAFPPNLRAALAALTLPGPDEIERMGEASVALARHYAEATGLLLARTGLSPADVAALGVHGQTIRHRPQKGFTLQLNHPALVAELTGIDVVADLRSRDVAAGGEGAPLVPAFHAECFTGDVPRVVLNIGGIANISVLPARSESPTILGGDTGPGNMLIDTLDAAHHGSPLRPGRPVGGLRPRQHDASRQPSERALLCTSHSEVDGQGALLARLARRPPLRP